MKQKKKSAPFRMFGLIFFSVVASGCAETAWPTWVTGEPDQNYMEAQRVIKKPVAAQGGADLAWPNLADVPLKPQDVAPRKAREAEIAAMEDDRKAAEELTGVLEGDAVLLEEALGR